MALIGLTEAAKLTGKDKATIHRALKSGRLSFTVGDGGERQIDPAELERVFAIKTTDELQRNSSNPQRNYTQPTVKVAELLAQLESERMKTLGLQERLADKDAVIDDLRARLDREGEERRKLTAILTDQRAQPTIAPPPEIAATPEPPPAGNGTTATNDARPDAQDGAGKAATGSTASPPPEPPKTAPAAPTKDGAAWWAFWRH